MAEPSEGAVKLAQQVLAKCMAYDPHFPNPSKANLRAWALHITLKNPTVDDMMEAVDKFYSNNTDGTKPLPATISSIAASIRLDRLSREGATQRADLEARIDAKAEGRRYQPEPVREKLSLREWEARSGECFPRVQVGKRIPREEPRRLSLEGSGHVCALPRVVSRVAWQCEDCGQVWRESDKQWVMGP